MYHKALLEELQKMYHSLTLTFRFMCPYYESKRRGGFVIILEYAILIFGIPGRMLLPLHRVPVKGIKLKPLTFFDRLQKKEIF
jgi:hypothetical protein